MLGTLHLCDGVWGWLRDTGARNALSAGKLFVRLTKRLPCLPGSFRQVIIAHIFLCCSCLMFHCGCSTPSKQSIGLPLTLPPEVSINHGAGRGDCLYLKLRVENEKDLLFVVDTGFSYTVLDKSLEPVLSKRLGTRPIWYGAFGVRAGGLYAAPRLYVGNTRLQTGHRVVTDDLRLRLRNPLAGRPIMGILGMDCLRHYCIQLDFADGKMRFLDPDHLDTTNLGKAFHLTSFFGDVNVQTEFCGRKDERFKLDTGAPNDFFLSKRLFQRQLKQQTFGGENYRNVAFLKCPAGIWFGHQSLLGLRFLARHLVTFNFPEKTMYLQRQSVGPLLMEGRTLGWWETRGEAAFDDSIQSLAQRIMVAPNLYHGDAAGGSGIFSWSPLYFVPVDSPKAKLRLVELPSGDYHLEYDSKITTNAEGIAKLSLNYFPEKKAHSTKVIQERGSIFLLHDYNASKEDMAPWAFLLAQAGYRIFLLDLRGHGESTGETISYGKCEVADVSHVLDHVMEKRASNDKAGVLGIGYGAYVALHWAARDPRIGTVVAIAPYNQPNQAIERMARDSKATISPEIMHQALTLAADRLNIQWADWSGEAAIRQLQWPILLVGGGNDSISNTEDMHVLGQAAPPGSKCLLVPAVDHQNIGYWFPEIAEPVKAWFQTHMIRGKP